MLDANGNPVSMDYKFQWTLQNSEGRFSMLNTDMELAYDIDVDNFGDGTDCEVVVGYQPDNEANSCVCTSQPTNCNSAETFELVQTYANVSISLFHKNVHIVPNFGISVSKSILYIFPLGRN